MISFQHPVTVPLLDAAPQMITAFVIARAELFMIQAAWRALG